jgi:PKD repeat protein
MRRNDSSEAIEPHCASAAVHLPPRSNGWRNLRCSGEGRWIDRVRALGTFVTKSPFARFPGLYRTTLLVLMALACGAASAGTTRLAWDASTDPRVVGYTVHYGTSSGSYATAVDVGNQTTHTLAGLPDGHRYFIAVTAYDGTGARSAYSNQVSVAHLARVSQPAADFVAAPTSGPAPLKVAFTNRSTGDITTYQWDFGDGSGWVDSGASPTADATHTYVTPGTYSVHLTASGPGGRSVVTRTDLVNVHATPGRPAMTLFGDTSPRNVAVPDAQPATLGLRFASKVAGSVIGVRFYKGADNTGVHSGQVWTADGTLLASATFTNETPTGWQEVRFAMPVRIDAHAPYVASYHAPRGRYAVDVGHFKKTVVSGDLYAPASTISEPNGRIAFGGTPAFPQTAGKQANYWIDVLFLPDD